LPKKKKKKTTTTTTTTTMHLTPIKNIFKKIQNQNLNILGFGPNYQTKKKTQNFELVVCILGKWIRN
jgi:hypothetical protein